MLAGAVRSVVDAETGAELATICDNHQTRRTATFPTARTSSLRIELSRPGVNIPAALFRVQVS